MVHLEHTLSSTLETKCAIDPSPNKSKKKKPKKKTVLEEIDPFYVQALAKYPVKLCNTRAKGRHAAAAQDISQGTVVCLEQATAFVVRSDYIDQQCHVCLSDLKQKLMCSDCKMTFYCSQACLEKDSLHLLACSPLAAATAIGRSTDVDPDLLRLMTLLTAQRCKEASNELQNNTITLPPTPYWCVNELLSHKEQANPAFIKVVTEASQRLISEMPERMQVPVEDLVTLACRINCNAHGLGDNHSRNTDVALGLFPMGAMFFNHACNPNAAFVGLANGQLAFRTIRPVKADEELTVSYIDLYAPRDERRQELLQTKHFWCKCKRCTTPIENSVDRLLSGVVCSNCRQDVYCIPPLSIDDVTRGLSAVQASPNTSWKCARCGHNEATETVYSILEKGQQNYMNGLVALRQKRDYRGARQQLEPFINVSFDDWSENALAPLHALRLNAAIPLMNCLRRLNDIKGAVEVNRFIINLLEEHAKQHLPENTAEISDFWQNLGELADVLAEQYRGLGRAPLEKRWFKEARQAFTQAASIRSIVYGADHPKTKHVQQFVACASC
ncbi:uncharacterized protein BYT42DRAFT_557594 [Radiomyces spectabilis]|uniref:uncharacterized protein n=1 Tax=Radiomyces spectabilis TaxID=64574 RepID=UPI00221ECDB1|nr:uncharacterized protein BYT42DRAFT_557594 [Radiomyces spectabilis]KAI8391649.1 hypothetical protein BYT42DRAFT_557594 [Radiomyces spectabilis]